MQRRSATLLIVFVLALLLAPTAYAAEGQPPIGTCPRGYQLVEHHDMGEHPDHHIGLTVDYNGNGMLCMKEVGNGLHVHVDDVIMKP